jgi:hypothetical protein
MKRTTLERIAPLLDVLRDHPALREVEVGEFILDDRDFLHFHEEPEGIYADVRLAKGRVHMPVSSRPEQLEFLERIDQILSALESRARDRKRRAWLAPKQ